MSRIPLIEAIHEARYDWQTRADKDKPAARQKLYSLSDRAAAKSNPPTRPDVILDALFEDYKLFRRIKRQQEWPKL
jgi:hypothetical protein